MKRLTTAVLLGLPLLVTCVAHAVQCSIAEYRKSDKGWLYSLAKVEGADQATFHVLTGPDPYLGSIPCVHDSGYAVDRYHAYWQGKLIAGADPRTFSYLQWDYSRDRSHVYYGAAILSGADVRTFRYLGQEYFRDAVHVYHRGAMINGADAKTFVLIGSMLARDTKHVFFGATEVDTASPINTAYLGGPYWTSDRTIFWRDKPLSEADSASFHLAPKVEHAFWAEDKGYYYWNGKAFNKRECRKVGPVILACGSAVWFQGWRYPRIDSSSLRYLGGFPPKRCEYEGEPVYQDKHGVYVIDSNETVQRFLHTQEYPRIEHLDRTSIDRLCRLGGTADIWPEGWFNQTAPER